MPTNDPVFVDTSGWVAILNKDDQLHVAVAELMRQFGAARRMLVTTDWVLAETGNGLARTPARTRFAPAVAAFAQSPHGTLVRVDAALFVEALDMYAASADKTWGLVDCASFLAMRSGQMTDALTSDRHFQQADSSPCCWKAHRKRRTRAYEYPSSA